MDPESSRTPLRRLRSARHGVFVLGAFAALSLAGFAGCGDEETPRESSRDALQSLPGAIYDPPKPAPALRFTRADGTAFDLANERGRVVLVYFGFTECPDVCPAALRRWAEVRPALGADSSRVRFVFVSVDPEHDTPTVAAAYARRFDPSFLGLSGTAAEVGEIALAWGIAKGRTHTSQTFVVDPQGLLAWGYGVATTPEEIVRGVRALVRAGTTPPRGAAAAPTTR